MIARGISAAIGILIIIAFCNPVWPDVLDRITDSELKSYTVDELDRGAPSLCVTSRALYRQALEMLKGGQWEKAREYLLLSAELSGEYPDPLLTLARIELLHAHPDFLFHLMEGIKRLSGGFLSQSLLAANAALLVVTAALGGLLITLVALLAKYRSLLDHKLREIYHGRFSFPPASWLATLIIVALLIMRLGLAIYAAILMVVLWLYTNKKEKTVIATFVIILSACSYFAGYADAFLAALDPGSVTRRLSLINERGANEELLRSIASIDNRDFVAERDYAIGTLLYRLGYLEEAKTYLLSSVSQRSKPTSAYLNLGNVYFKEGDFDKALAGYQNVIAIDSTNAIAHYNIGQAYIQKMLFAQSSASLKKASEFGIESYRETHPSTRVRNQTIYEEGFNPADLWPVALREGKTNGYGILSELLRPYLFIPFEKLWMLLVASLITAICTHAMLPRSWRAFRCENCGMAACPDCADTETGVRLCRDCSRVMQDLTSVKVMEALLRHRRQKVAIQSNRRTQWGRFLFPGVSPILYGKTYTGACIATVNVAVLLLLIWRGLYFADPAAVYREIPLWKLIVPLAVLALGYIHSCRMKAPQEPKNYWILPPETRIEKKRIEPGSTDAETEPGKSSDPVAAFLDSF